MCVGVSACVCVVFSHIPMLANEGCIINLYRKRHLLHIERLVFKNVEKH